MISIIGRCIFYALRNRLANFIAFISRHRRCAQLRSDLSANCGRLKDPVLDLTLLGTAAICAFRPAGVDVKRSSGSRRWTSKLVGKGPLKGPALRNHPGNQNRLNTVESPER